MPDGTTVSARDLARAGRATDRQIDYWTSNGWLCAEKDNPGSGYGRRYAEHELEVVRLVGNLAREGVRVSHAFWVVRELLEYGSVEFAGMRLVRADHA